MTTHFHEAPKPGGASPRRAGPRAAAMRALKITALVSSIAAAGYTSTVFGMAATPAPAPAPAPVDVPPVPEGLKGIPVPTPSNLNDFVLNKPAAIRLGKALFWDMQLGSDGKTACASCHFQAGADNRSRNAVSPGLDRMATPSTPNPDTTFQVGSPNSQFKAADFPFHKFADPKNRDSAVLRTNNDVAGSAGVFNTRFVSGLPGAVADTTNPAGDTTFQVGGVQTRKVEPRNTPTMINAIFNFRQFWDGRAQYLFNGATPFGALDSAARVYKKTGLLITSVDPVQVRIDNASLASLATGPALSDFEMSGAGRNWADIGVRLLAARPLVQQQVSTTDSVLAVKRHASGVGLTGTYEAMVKEAFKPEWWSGTQKVTVAGKQFSQAQANFSLFFGLAIQMYGSTLVSDDSPFDRLMAGQTTALTPTQAAGMGLFFGKAKCADCHGGAEFTTASVRNILKAPLNRMVMGDGTTAVYDVGFYNTAVRQTLEDIANGAKNPLGRPMASVALAQQVGSVEFKNLIGIPANITVAPGERIAVNGAFKTSTVRNVELTAPYFHNGGTLTLRQVVEFYNRGGDHFNNNIKDVDAEILPLGLTDAEMDSLVDFMKSLTDDRVRKHAAPFDHPQLFVVNGHKGSTTAVENTGNGTATDEWLEVKVVGASGYAPADRPVDFRQSISPTIAGPGTGLLASYFTNITLSGTPVLQRSEAVDFAWDGQAPVPGVGATMFSARWEGYLVVPTTGTYTLQTRSDDGVRLMLNDIPVINNWTIHAPTDNTSVAISMTAGQRVKVVLEYYQNAGTSAMQLKWKPPGQTVFTAIPETVLDPASLVTPVVKP